jgi:hypothetical protein
MGSPQELVVWGRSVGLVAAGVALTDGIWMIARRHEATCPDGKTFGPGETDFTCYVHPLAHQGIAVVAFAVLFAVLVLLAASAVEQLAEPADSKPTASTP